MTWWQFVLFVLVMPITAGALGALAASLFWRRCLQVGYDLAYDRGWDHCTESLGFAVPKTEAEYRKRVDDLAQRYSDQSHEVSIDDWRAAMEGKRPGRHSRTQLPDPPPAEGAAPLPPSAGGPMIA